LRSAAWLLKLFWSAPCSTLLSRFSLRFNCKNMARKCSSLRFPAAPMSERTLVLHKPESFQVPAIVADVGPEATKRFFEFLSRSRSATRTRGSRTTKRDRPIPIRKRKFPVHHKLEEILNEYLKVSKLREGRTRRCSQRHLAKSGAWISTRLGLMELIC
jgi:hypothetical protein